MFFFNPLIAKINKHTILECSKKELLPFLVMSVLEEYKIAGVCNTDNNQYQMETPDGIEILISQNKDKTKNEVFIYFLNSASEALELKNKKIERKEDLLKIKNDINRCIKELSTDTHGSIKKNELKILKNIIKTNIFNSNFNFDNLVTIEQNKAYGEAIFDLILNEEIYALQYFSKKRKIHFNQLPKKLIDPSIYHKSIPIKRTSRSESLESVLKVRTSRLSNKTTKASTIYSWSKYDSKKNIQICIDNYSISEFPVKPEETKKESFFINKEGEKVTNIIGSFLDKHRKAFHYSEDDIIAEEKNIPLIAFNSLLPVFSKACFLSTYLSCGEHQNNGVLFPICIKGHYFFIDSTSAYYAFREAIYFKEKGEKVSLTLCKDRLIFKTSKGKKIAFSIMFFAKNNINNVDFMHENNCLYSPFDISSAIQNYEMFLNKKVKNKKIRVIHKIEGFIKKNKLSEVKV